MYFFINCLCDFCFSFHFKTEERGVSMSMLGFTASGKMAARWLHKFFDRSYVTLFFQHRQELRGIYSTRIHDV